ncbi:MAG: hypothetical protein IJ557_08010 [Bacteroidaceae bacterium]|nr:hypothetical protein [Bacteroidaceae bacterium]
MKEKVKNYDNLLTGRLINYVENPDSIGYIDGRWYSPKYDRRYKPGAFDPANFGIGIDRKTNEYVDSGELIFHKDNKGREYLTEEEERNARNHVIANAEDSYVQRLAYAQKALHSSNIPSEMKKAITISAIYNLGQSYVANNLFEDNALMDAFLNGTDLDYSNQVNKYYEIKRKGDRGIKTNKFIQDQQQASPIVPKVPQGGGIRAEGGQLNTHKLWDDLSMAERAEMIRVAVNNDITDLQEIRDKYNEFAKGGPEDDGDYTYTGGRLPSVTVSAPALPAYQDQFTGRWYGIGPGGRKVNKPAGFDPSGARVYTSPEAFERARLNRAYADDLNHYGEFGDMVRGLATDLVMAPAGDVVAEPLGLLGKNLYRYVKPFISNNQHSLSLPQTAQHVIDGDKGFKFTLDWSPEGWFGRYRPGGKYDAADIAALESHVPEYHLIEKTAQANGTWMRDAKGNLQRMDPREWVIRQSGDYKRAGLTGTTHYNGVSGRYGRNYEFDGRAWTDLEKSISKSFADSHTVFDTEPGYLLQLDYPASTNVFTVDAKGLPWSRMPDGAFLDYVPQPRFADEAVNQAVNHGFGATRFNNIVEGNGQKVTDVVIHEGTPRKSVLGNNGNFDLTNKNIYKSLLPFGIGTWVLSDK